MRNASPEHLPVLGQVFQTCGLGFLSFEGQIYWNQILGQWQRDYNGDVRVPLFNHKNRENKCRSPEEKEEAKVGEFDAIGKG